MVNRDPRYHLVLSMYEKGHVRSFNDIFRYVPKTVVAKNLGTKVDRFTKLMKRVEKFTLEDIVLIGTFCDMSLDIMTELWKEEFRRQKEAFPDRPI
jgi:hypothetical protein